MSEQTELGGVPVERGMCVGTVIEDRWGLRWRADYNMARGKGGQKGWLSRSAGLYVWQTDEQMLDRGPLKFIRVDQVFAGDAARLAREAGQAADEAATFQLDEDGDRELSVETVVVELERLRGVERQYEDLQAAVAAAWPGVQALLHTAWPVVAATLGLSAEPEQGR